MKLTASLSGTDSIRRKLLQIGSGPAFRALAATAEDAQDYAKGQAAKHNKTGALVRSVYLKRLGTDAFEVGHDLQHAPHALFVHWGTKPHVIRPKKKAVLRWPSGGSFAFARKVHHPGYKGDPWMVRAAAQAPLDFERHVLAQLARITSGA